MRERRLSERRKALYKQRKEKIERSFADSKNNHEYRYAMYKGIEKKSKLFMAYLCYAKYKKYSNKKRKNIGIIPSF